jgi:ubiquinone/menaquinone biosynthesis C-methylase UbiE
MHAPEKYEGNKSVARRDIEEAMTDLIQRMKFTRKEVILDYGCGAGSTGFKFFKPIAEEYDSFIHAVDISSEMIQHAKENFSHDRVRFTQGNILEENFPLKDVQFDRIFSAYVFHYIKDYKEAMRRLFKMLKPGGEFGFSALARSNLFKMYSVIGEDPRFKKYMEGYQQFVPQWFEEKESAEHAHECFIKTAEEAGFVIKYSKISYQTFFHPKIDTLIELYLALNPYVNNFPKELLGEVRAAIKSGMLKMNGLNEDADSIETRHEMLTFLVERPL